MKRVPLDIYDDMPRAMKAYLRAYGYHFSKKACDYAVSLMKRYDQARDEMVKVDPMDKKAVMTLLDEQSVTLENDVMYDSTYVANMIKADFYGDSIEDDYHMAKHIRCIIDDPDAVDGMVFNRWYADMVHSGIPIEWEDML